MTTKRKEIEILTQKEIIQRIYTIRGQRVMLDRDLAAMYGVPVKVLNQSVKRNIKRFPDDFMIKLNFYEFSDLKSQIVTSSWGGARKLPCAFTENGVAMLSSVLNSERAIQVNIQIMRIFTETRPVMVSTEEIQRKIKILANQSVGHKFRLDVVFDAINALLDKSKE